MPEEIIKPVEPGDSDWNTDVKNIELTVDGSGDFTKSKLIWLKDTDLYEDQETGKGKGYFGKPGKPIIESVLTYEGKGVFVGYAHSLNGKVYYSTDHGIGLFNVTAWSVIPE